MSLPALNGRLAGGCLSRLEALCRRILSFNSGTCRFAVSGIAIVCRSTLGNNISREIVSRVASVLAAPGQRRGILDEYDSSRIHVPLYRLHAQHSADRSAAAHRSGLSASDRPCGGSAPCICRVSDSLYPLSDPYRARRAAEVF